MGKIVGSWLLKHGESNSPLYAVWCAMKQRCYNKNNKKYAIYGGKGVGICEQWRTDFATFKAWALSNGYRKGLTIDRIDGDKDYCPQNCRWVDYVEQNHNLKKNKILTLGDKTMCVSQWAKYLGIGRSTLNNRLEKGWSVRKALTTPVDLNYRRNYSGKVC